MSDLKKFNIYNSLNRKKEEFVPIKYPFVGMYVCGPTVYGDPHLGHARPAITFDLLFRYLKHLGYKVRYVRNITDVGHLENDADEGEDKIGKKAKLEQLEPMEIVDYYTDRYHKAMEQLNVLRPSIEPRASGHIIEQIEMTKKILEAGYAYISNGSVYFDVLKYNEKYNYGKLSGRVLEELFSNTRELDGQHEKKNSFDFALWKKASPEHIMRWPSPWSEGFPGWHLECSVMGHKYLGEQFDIHGGGMDLLFPHHECEIAQNTVAIGENSIKYWIHNNMITINGQKMGKSLGNFITLEEIFTGNHKLLEQAYSPMTIRFFILQAHYRSTLDFSNEALKAAEKGLARLLKGSEILEKLKTSDSSDFNAVEFKNKCYEAMNDDLNSPIVIANLFEALKTINSIDNNTLKIDSNNLQILKETYNTFLFDILGIKPEKKSNTESEVLKPIVDLVLNLRLKAKKEKDFGTSDYIRDELTKLGFKIKDTKEGFEWEL
ncbi:MAG TPA: cysteine--tRNA ligase [Bacteroidales bacterium]|jgi:cysteinyl-tRNA synthetase|nr:cysteine--tRNA ligase [Bacteroidales bacterium]HOL97124.1 cysteine--tRNA ligase [Bacteroidales bacterium]HOM35417.1 cysteine--tRNA ligase [Bacteroidales bacterium]HPD23092.1 cysteine--tRNA ligase [Bacteroidales bacterium]HRS99380.1 cysteine--tRNA ligase [Bacteroidales bacterium]